LVELICSAAEKYGITKNEVIHHGGHSFPDVTIKNTGVGIELKGSESSRRFNGNSVVASTMIPGLKKIYLLYWVSQTNEVGYRDYFECVPTPVVTHSPRFQLDIDLKPTDSMFGLESGKAGNVSELIFGSHGIDSDKIIQWMVDRAKNRGETPWWISHDENLPTGSTGLIKFTNLSIDKRRAFMKAAFLAFPRIISKKSNNKYTGLFEWAIAAKSILSTRDDFSAGGKEKIVLAAFNTSAIEVPKVIQVALESLAVSDTVYLSELSEPYGKKFESAQIFINFYRKILPSYINYIYNDVSKFDKNNIGPARFSEALADLITSKINPSTILK